MTDTRRVTDPVGQRHIMTSRLGTRLALTVLPVRPYALYRCSMPHHANLRCRTGLIVSRLCGSTLRSRTTLRRHDLPTSSSACSLQTQQCIFRPNVDVVRGYATNQEKKVPLLKKTSPYWHLFETRAKRRWQGRSLLDVLSTEFRERSMDYYVCMDRSSTLSCSQLLRG